MERIALTADQCREFHENGWIGPFRLYGPEEAPRWRSLIEGLFPGGAARLQANRSEHNRHLDTPELLELVTRPALAHRVCSLIGDDALLWRTHGWCKEPGGPEIPWHQDFNYWPLEPTVVVSAWIAFSEVSQANACMRIIPGSHTKILPHVKARPGVAFGEEADPSRIPIERALPVELQAGEFILFNERLLHHSPVNHSDQPRLALAARCIASLVRVTAYDGDQHVLHPLGSAPDRFGFNRLAVPAALA